MNVLGCYRHKITGKSPLMILQIITICISVVNKFRWGTSGNEEGMEWVAVGDRRAARRGGNVAKEARLRLEQETGKPVVTPLNAKHILGLDNGKPLSETEKTE